MSKFQPIQVPLIQDDLKYNETILQITNTLEILQHCVNNIYDHVNKCINQTQQTVRSLQNRTENCQNQIEKLKTIQKSVTILSSSKFPYQDKKKYKINFKPQPELKLKRIIPQENENVDVENKLKFYHVKTHDMLRKNMELSCDESLGQIPNNIDSITSSMLFNTCENVYERYVIIDPLSTNTKKILKEDKNNIKQIKMEEAPMSLNQGDDSLLINKQSYVYSPSVEKAPFLELPLDLPDLMGFVDDFRYTGDDILKIPNKDVVLKADENINQLQNTTQASIPKPTKEIYQDRINNVSDQPVLNEKPINVISQPASISSAAPPPPPLPPPSPPPSNEPPIKIETAKVPPTPVSDSLHSNLMEAIRNAGGTGKAKLKTVDSITKSESTPNTTGVDLMSDLHAKLLLRRKGISGQMKESSSLMDKLLMNIPPPPRLGAESDSSDNDEGENDAEWDD